MANTTTVSGNVVEITGLDADWIATTDLSTRTEHGPVKVTSIQFSPSATGDILIVRDGSITGPVMFHVKCTADTDQRVKYFHAFDCNPAIDISECTFGTAADARVILTIR